MEARHKNGVRFLQSAVALLQSLCINLLHFNSILYFLMLCLKRISAFLIQKGPYPNILGVLGLHELYDLLKEDLSLRKIIEFQIKIN